MKKNGFTITELIITLGIISVVTALLMPQIAKLKPDENKLRVINAHSKITGHIDNILDDDSIYRCEKESTADGDEKEGLACDDAPDDSELSTFSGDTKFENVLAYKLGLKETNDADDLKWKETNGTTWSFEKIGANNTAYYIITIDVDGKKGVNKYYNEDASITKPDRYRFKINNYGGTTAFDAMTEAYLKNPMKLNDKKKDSSAAAKIATNKKYVIKTDTTSN